MIAAATMPMFFSPVAPDCRPFSANGCFFVNISGIDSSVEHHPEKVGVEVDAIGIVDEPLSE
jgi:hypothetical protein